MSTTVAQAVKSAKAQKTNLERIESRLYDVIDFAPDTPTPIDLGLKPDVEVDTPRVRHIYASDGRFLGYTGMKYVSLQPRDFLNAIVDTVRESQLDIDLSKLTFTQYNGGRRIAFQVPVGGEIEFPNAKGKTENIIPYARFYTGFAGEMPTRIELYTYRRVCLNGMRVMEAGDFLNVRHTENGNAKALLFVEEILNMSQKAAEHGQWLKTISNVEVSEKRVQEFARKLAGIKTEKDLEAAKTRKRRTYEQILGAIEHEMDYTGLTAFGLLQGATYYTNHVAKNAGDEYVTAGSGVGFNQKAVELVEEMA